MNVVEINRIIDLALEEDLNTDGDITTKSIVCNERVTFTVITKEAMVICGLKIVEHLFSRYSKEILYQILSTEGEYLNKNTVIIRGKARAAVLLSIERVVLNIMQHASAVASLTYEFVQAVKHTKAVIRSTRKTIPGIRILQKYAVEIGGGQSLRIGLSDGILIKDNHIASCGNILTAVTRVAEKYPKMAIAVECDNLMQVRDVLTAEQVSTILLDNMSIEEIRTAVTLNSYKVSIEVSGGVNLANVVQIADTSVDYIAVGMITHSTKNKDISLEVTIKD